MARESGARLGPRTTPVLKNPRLDGGVLEFPPIADPPFGRHRLHQVKDSIVGSGSVRVINNNTAGLPIADGAGDEV